jgi:hypothetical protein
VESVGLADTCLRLGDAVQMPCHLDHFEGLSGALQADSALAKLPAQAGDAPEWHLMLPAQAMSV